MGRPNNLDGLCGYNRMRKALKQWMNNRDRKYRETSFRRIKFLKKHKDKNFNNFNLAYYPTYDEYYITEDELTQIINETRKNNP